MVLLETTPLPGPPELPFLGNIADINNFEVPLWSFHELAEKYGEVYQLRFPGLNPGLFVSSVALTNELCDEKRFRKKIGALLGNMRRGLGDGLFTINTEDEGWGIAHRILMPAFGPMSIRGMFDEMKDIAIQLSLKWARHGSQHINVTEDFTRLSLDTLALCGMDFRFNGFYQPELHPFVESMQRFMFEADKMCRRLPLPAFFYREKDRQFEYDIGVMRKTAEEVVRARREDRAGAGGSNKKKKHRTDLLEAMLNGVDPKTGKMLSDSLIVDNLIAFLAAGHETTSGMLSFVFYELLHHPEAMRRAREEVHAVCGTGSITVEHIGRLEYIAAILRESLRLHPTIPGFMVEAYEDTTIGSFDKKYPVKQWQTVTCLLGAMHLDKSVYGEDSHEFKPERMMDEPFKQREEKFGNCWKPFGNGLRGCIGRPFAWQESLLICAMLIQNFDFAPADPDYRLLVKQNTTVKPKDFFMVATLRDGLTPTTLEQRLSGASAGSARNQSSERKLVTSALDGSCSTTTPGGGTTGKPLTILYGSESGTCQSLAQKLAADARSYGTSAAVVDCLDTATKKLAASAADGNTVVIITPSYEGRPPENAKLFVDWIETLEAEAGGDGSRPLSGLKYAVYGCGDRAWLNTFHRIPKLIDDTLERLGAQRIATLGLTDMADGGDVFGEFEAWEDELLWPALSPGKKQRAGNGSDDVRVTGGYKSNKPQAGSGLENSLSVDISSTARASTLRYPGLKQAVVTKTRLLTAPGCSPAKRHVEIRLPEGSSYRPGDHLSVLPTNPRETVLRAMRRFALPLDSRITIRDTGAAGMATALPTNVGVPAYHILSEYVELGHVATKRNIASLASSCHNTTTKAALSRLVENEIYVHEIANKRASVLDLLELFPDVDMALGAFLAMLPPLRTRLYSISSSPSGTISDDSSSGVIASLSYSVLETDDGVADPSLSTKRLGVATSYLSSLQPGDIIPVSVRQAHGAFHLPDDPLSAQPLICIAAGVGIAPFRGFIQERAAALSALTRQQAQRQKKPPPILLFFGCREPGLDDLYRDELDKWEELGAVAVHRAYSRDPSHAEAHGCKYVQERLEKEEETIWDMWEKGAMVYICGSKGLATGVGECMTKMRMRHEGGSEEEASEWLRSLRNERYTEDIFS